MSKSASEIESNIHRMLHECSLAARGLWIDMRHVIDTQSDRPGDLRIASRPLFAEQLANMAGCPADTTAGLLRELCIAGLVQPAVDGDLTVYHSPTLARLKEVRRKGVERVQRHKERKRVLINTASNGRGVNYTEVNTPINAPPSPPAPSPSFSPTPPLLSSPSPPSPVLGATGGESAGGGGGKPGKGGKPPEPDLPLLLAIHPGFVAAWAEWRAHLRAKRVRVTPAAAERQITLCLDLGPERAIAAIRHSIAGSYQGLFEPTGAGKANGVNGHAGPGLFRQTRDDRRIGELRKLREERESREREGKHA